MSKNTIIKQINDLLEQEKSNGVRDIYITPENWKKLNSPIVKAQKTLTTTTQNPIPIANSVQEEKETYPPQNIAEKIASKNKEVDFLYDNHQESPRLLILVDLQKPQPLNLEQNELLTKMLAAIQFPKKGATILAIDNGTEEEISTEVKRLNPSLILLMGAKILKQLQPKSSLLKIKNQWFSFANIDIIATYHPQFLINNPKFKQETWKTLQKLQEKLS